MAANEQDEQDEEMAQDHDVQNVRQLIGVMIGQSTPADAWSNLTHVYDIRQNGVMAKRPDRSLLPLIASPSVMARLLYRADSRKPYFHDSHIYLTKPQTNELAFVSIQKQLPAVLRRDMDHILTDLIGDAPVVTDAQDTVDYSSDATHARQRARYDLFHAALMTQYRQYSQDEALRAASKSSSSYLYVMSRPDHDIDIIDLKLVPGFYFLAVPYRENAAVYPLENGKWAVHRPFIMSVDYAELESFIWGQSYEADEGRIEHFNTSGIIRCTPVLTTTHVNARVDPHADKNVGIHVYSDHASRKIELFARRTGSATTYGYRSPARPAISRELWHERIMVSAAEWENFASEDDRAAYARQAAIDNPSGSPPRPGGGRRDRVRVRPHYLSITWRLFALGDQDDVMADHTFWARYIAHRAMQQGTIVTTDRIPPEEELTLSGISIVSKQAFYTEERVHSFIDEQSRIASQPRAMEY